MSVSDMQFANVLCCIKLKPKTKCNTWALLSKITSITENISSSVILINNQELNCWDACPWLGGSQKGPTDGIVQYFDLK